MTAAAFILSGDERQARGLVGLLPGLRARYVRSEDDLRGAPRGFVLLRFGTYMHRADHAHVMMVAAERGALVLTIDDRPVIA